MHETSSVHGSGWASDGLWPKAAPPAPHPLSSSTTPGPHGSGPCKVCVSYMNKYIYIYTHVHIYAYTYIHIIRYSPLLSHTPRRIVRE